MCKKKVTNENALIDQHFTTISTHSQTLTQAVITTVVIILFLVLSYYAMRYICSKRFFDREPRHSDGLMRRMSRRWMNHNEIEPTVRYIQPLHSAQPMATLGIPAMAINPAMAPAGGPAMYPNNPAGGNPAPENRARNV